VVFPEYSSHFSTEMDSWLPAAQDLHGEFVTALGALAKRLSIHLVAGLIETADASHVRNAIVAVAPTGALVAVYRKVHLYDAFGQRESDWVEPGTIEAPQLFDWEGFTVGMQTCYDIRFPEMTRRLVDAGADLVLVPSEWVRGPLKEHHWRILLTARALENTIYLAAADHAPPVGVGNSMVLDPMGVELATIGEEPGIAVAMLDAARIASVREINPALALRRFRVTPL
ncbi:MAG: carbon-nitrogen hydrolase family protein, partial [Rhodoglobus sp.]